MLEESNSALLPPTRVLPVDIDGQTVFMEVTVLGGEQEIAGRVMSFEGVRAAIEAMTSGLRSAAEKAQPSRLAMEFGCEVAAEAGNLTALFVKGSGKANVKITLEWGDPTIEVKLTQ
jgi:hypothetical protein